MERPEPPDNPEFDEETAEFEPDPSSFGERPINADVPIAEQIAVRRAEAFDPGEEPSPEAAPRPQAGRIARSTAFFSVATAASRVAGLGREIVAAGFYGISGPMSAFTIAFQVPNLVRALFADAALQPAFVPVFTELLGKRQYREAFRLASTLLLLITMVLGVITALFVVLAPIVMPVFAPGFKGEILDLTVSLSQVMFPILILLGISGVVVGILNSYDRFGAFAISPLFWNLTIIVVLVVLEPMFHGRDKIYAYAIGILAGTLVQLLIPAWDLRNTPFRFKFSFDWRHPGVRRVLLLMLPVTISLGLINFNLLINSFFGSLVSDQAPAAIDKAFRIYQLPQGIFSVAIATVLFPTLARFANAGEIGNLRATMANGMRQILFVLLPAAAAILALSDPMIRLVYQRGAFEPAETTVVATALFWFAFSLPTNGLYLLQTRTFFSLQRPWQATSLAMIDLVVSAIAALALYKPYGVGGIVAGTGIGTTTAVIAQALILRREFGGLELGRLFSTASRITIASAALAGVGWGVWFVLDDALGRGLAGQIVSLGSGLAVGAIAYFAVAKLLRVAELEQIMRLLRRR
ncbi:MAG: putative peptidoglycan lipid flippase [Solirubrobacterales bacterium]|jgi:putative peptidoglycan lipid II flippase|nr:putative peptidoglycan lipid flippase [Solirubrobacterales bacterium]